MKLGGRYSSTPVNHRRRQHHLVDRQQSHLRKEAAGDALLKDWLTYAAAVFPEVTLEVRFQYNLSVINNIIFLLIFQERRDQRGG